MNESNFLGLDFRPITIHEIERLDPFLKKYPSLLSGYTFASLLAWESVFSYAYVFLDHETLLISAWIETTKTTHLLEPIGEFSRTCQELLLKLISKIDYPVKIYGVSETFLAKNKEFCSHFKDDNDRDLANYLYKTEDLALLQGGHYEKKRNLISQAESLYDLKIEPINEKHFPYCPKILEGIGAKEEQEMSLGLKNELKALDKILNYFTQLKLKGCLISIENIPAAFSIYGKLDEKTVDIYFEKADKKFKGLYQFINRETAKMILEEGYEFINREEDAGVEGLKKAKTSYFPIKLISSHLLTFDS